LEDPLTVAVNCCVPLGTSDALAGETATLIAGVTVTVAEALLIVSWALVAVTVNVPGVLPAVKSPVEETVPPVAVQVTAVLDEFATVAVNCCVPLGESDTLVGEMPMLSPLTAPLIIALLVGSWTLVAHTMKVPTVLPAVNSPVDEMVPPFAVHVTAWFVVLATVAVNCCVVPLGMMTLVGEMLTLTS